MDSIEITCQQLQERLSNGETVKLIDCREPWEFETVRLEGAELIPMNETPANLQRYRSQAGTQVVYCHHGIRSLQVAQWLRSQGVDNIVSLQGGIDQWSIEIDVSLPRY